MAERPAPPIPPNAGTPEDANLGPQPNGWIPPASIPRAPVDRDPLEMLALARLDNPLDRGLASQEHGAFAQSLVDRYGLLGVAMLLGAVPGYQGAKYAAQNLPGGSYLNSASKATTGLDLAGPTTTAPGWDQLLAGLRPILNTFNSK